MSQHGRGDASGGGTSVAVAMGSNLGDRWARIRAGLRWMEDEWDVSRISSVYETLPEGGEGQEDFLNLCVILESTPPPSRLLRELMALEVRAGRPPRGGGRGGARTLDLDLLLYGDRRIRRPDLVVPHPRMTGRAFVMVPLAEVAATWRVPGEGAAVGELARGLDVRGIRRLCDGSALLSPGRTVGS